MSAPCNDESEMAFPHAEEPARAVTGVSGAVTASPNSLSYHESNEPPRPSRDILDFIPGLFPYVTRLEWLENRNCELSSAMIEANQKRIAAEKLLTDRTMVMRKEREELQEAQERHTRHASVEEQKLNEMAKEMEDKTAALEKREEELKTTASKAKRIFPTAGPNSEVYDAIQSLGDWMEDGLRQFRNLSAGKTRLEQAIARWETKYCEPTIKIVKLQEHVRAEKEKHRKEYSKNARVMDGKAEELKQATATQTAAMKSLKEERVVFGRQQAHWRAQKASQLEGAELAVVQKLWLSIEEERVTPHIKAEAKRKSDIEVKLALEPQIRSQCARAKEEGRKTGYEAGESDGVKRGRDEGQAQAETKWKAKVISAERRRHAEGRSVGMAEGEAKGHAAGKIVGFADGRASTWNTAHASGKREGLEEGKTLGQSMEGESYFRGYHLGVLSTIWAVPSFYQADGQPTESHPYWRGRSVAQFIKADNQLSKQESVWYQADIDNRHILTLRHPSNAPIWPQTYWAGIQDGMENMHLNTTPVRTWQPQLLGHRTSV